MCKNASGFEKVRAILWSLAFLSILLLLFYRVVSSGQIQDVPVAPNNSIVTAKVLGYRILNSTLEGIEPEQVLYAFRVLMTSSQSIKGKGNFIQSKIGQTGKVYSKETPPPVSFGKNIETKCSIIGEETLKRKRLPIRPESPEWLFEKSDLICYGEIVNVTREINSDVDKEQPPGIHPSFEMQLCRVKVLKVLKGSDNLKGETIAVIKRKTRYYFRKCQKVVLYLKESCGVYKTLDLFGGEPRLASALCNINTLKGLQAGGIVAAVLNKEEAYLRIHIIRGRQKSDISIGDKTWENHLLKNIEIGEFDIVEVPLEEGSYTVLLESNRGLYPHSRLVEGHYPYIIITRGRWKPLYFDMDKIREDV